MIDVYEINQMRGMTPIMIRNWFIKKQKARFKRMETKVPHLPDNELKQWYSSADTQRITGNLSEGESSLLNVIESELTKRGFEYQLDY